MNTNLHIIFLVLGNENAFDCMANFGRYGPITSSLGGQKDSKIGPNIVQKRQNGASHDGGPLVELKNGPETLNGPAAKGENILKTLISFY